jgi:hypothetical protein
MLDGVRARLAIRVKPVRTSAGQVNLEAERERQADRYEGEYPRHDVYDFTRRPVV